ncbi:hypothetical protein GUJ93_ZPchr0013g35222 [Zizania palustris]|uniref:S-locus receptor kinase C-terminal domain-containing protein n=1 Tax=Zizania palustris TaxID=103762 RepID=A0A8J5X1P1_ZIZPA|nr:hypothetical protein GUJ93_ZPchr0013g35222 [Zizania palustris]
MGTITEVVDGSLAGQRSPGGEIVRCIHVGLLCVQENPADRPVMSAVNVMLNSDTVSLKAPSWPAFYIRKGGGGGTEAYSGRTSPMSPNKVSITELDPR